MAGALAALASAAGLLLRGGLATRSFTTVRGDVVEILTGRIFRRNGEGVAAEGIGWDAVTSMLVVPTLFVTLPALRCGSVRVAPLTTVGVPGVAVRMSDRFHRRAAAARQSPPGRRGT